MKTIKYFIGFGVNGLTFLILILFAMQFPAIALARDNAQNHSIMDAMATDTASSFINVKFYFGEQAHPPVRRTIGTYTTRRTTNSFLKSDAESCQWAFLSAIKTLYERTLVEGGNAVINIASITTGERMNSTSDFVCRAGNVVTKVYLQGDVVVLHE